MSQTCLSLYVSVLPSKESARHPNIALSHDLHTAMPERVWCAAAGRAARPPRLDTEIALEVPMSDNA